VHVFEDGLVVVEDSQVVTRVSQKRVVVTRMFEVMASSGCDHSKHVNFVQLTFFDQITAGCEVVEGLSNVGCMSAVVISDVDVAIVELR